MSLILRVDIDKPYGHHGIIPKILSKLREDYYFPRVNQLGYLKPTASFLKFCNTNNVKTILYFRNCTIPNKTVHDLIKEGGHRIGFHAENTRTITSFKYELERFENNIGVEVNTFTKHGSGTLKLGKNHYAPYEPERYKTWAKELDLEYMLGNGITNKLDQLYMQNGFFENMFWLEHHYRKSPLDKIDDIVYAAKDRDIVLVIHPANFFTFENVRNDLERTFDLAKKLDVKWLTDLTLINK